MSTIFNALYIDGENIQTRACATLADAKHWLAFEAIIPSEWEAWADALERSGEPKVSRDRTAMDADEVLAAWTGTPADEVSPSVTCWGDGDLLLSITEQTIFEVNRG